MPEHPLLSWARGWLRGSSGSRKMPEGGELVGGENYRRDSRSFPYPFPGQEEDLKRVLWVHIGLIIDPGNPKTKQPQKLILILSKIGQFEKVI